MENKIKCVVWDLDNTIWDGTLLEGDNLVFTAQNENIIKTLDSRGILHSIASKNEYSHAKEQLETLKIWDYFLCPQINWNPKSNSIKKIAEALNIGLDSIAFIDDSPYEIEEVKYSLPEVTCINAGHLHDVIDMACMQPNFITEDSKNRRAMYQADITRKEIEDIFEGPKEEFIKSLKMKFNIKKAQLEDLKRAEELTIRTHQLNTTGYTYSYDELCSFQESDRYRLLIAGLDDKFGSYGKIGISLIECEKDEWKVKLFLMSCRVISRGVGNVFLNYIIESARNKKVRLTAEFKHTDKNRLMYATYKFAGFKDIEEKNGVSLLEYDFNINTSFPDYIELEIESNIFMRDEI